MAEAIDALGERAVAPPLALIDIGKLVGAPNRQIARENIGGEVGVARDGGIGGGGLQSVLSDIYRGVSSRRAEALCMAHSCPHYAGDENCRQGNVSAAKLR